MQLSFEIRCDDINEFIERWSASYDYKLENLYVDNIGNERTELSRMQLFTWKNGGPISARKIQSIRDNYPLRFEGNIEERYLNHNQPGGAIWNIFYIHCLQPDIWPIFDQHVFRAMKYIQNQGIVEISTSDRHKYETYVNEYLPFVRGFGEITERTLDKALFEFGKFLKKVKRIF